MAVGGLHLKPSSQTVLRDVAAVTYHGEYKPHRLDNDVAVMKVSSCLIPVRCLDKFQCS